MKKIIAVFTLLILLAVTFNFSVVKATDTNEATVKLTYESKLQGNQVTISIYLGDFSGVEENSVMSASANLEFDNSQIDTIEGKAYEGWKVTVSAETKTALFETDTAKPNVKIGEVIFNLDPSSVTEPTTGKVAISSLNISDGKNLDETYPRVEQEYTLTPSSQEPSEDTNTIEGDLVVNTVQDETGTTNTVSNEITNNAVDNTVVTDTKLPQTGLSIALIVGIVAIVLLAIIGIIKYKSIEVK